MVTASDHAPTTAAEPELSVGKVGPFDARYAPFEEGEYLPNCPIDWIEPWEGNPRKTFSESGLLDLAQSIMEVGVQQPIVVRVRPGWPRLSIVMGESRYRAAKIAGAHTIPCTVRLTMSDQTALELALNENLHRKALTIIEEAEALSRLVAMGAKQRDLAARLAIAESTLSNRLRLLDLPSDVLDLVQQGTLEPTAARSLTRFAAWPEACSAMAKAVVNEPLTHSARNLEKGIPFAYALERAGLIKSLYTHDPGEDIIAANCLACPFNDYYAKDGERACFRPLHLKELKELKEAERQKRVREQIALARQAEDATAGPLSREPHGVPGGYADGDSLQVGDVAETTAALAPEYPRINSLPRGTLETFYGGTADTQRPPGCSLECPCAGKAINYEGKLVDVCTDPGGRLKKLRSAETSRQNQSRKKSAEESMDRLITLQTEGMPQERLWVTKRALAIVFLRLLQDSCFESKRAAQIRKLIPKLADKPLAYALENPMMDPKERDPLLASLSQLQAGKLENAIAQLILAVRLREMLDNPNRPASPEIAFLTLQEPPK